MNPVADYKHGHKFLLSWYISPFAMLTIKLAIWDITYFSTPNITKTNNNKISRSSGDPNIINLDLTDIYRIL
jgi:hypothetical protein